MKDLQHIKKVLSIAGSDCSGGAGIQADLKTIQAHGIYGMSVITSVTAQNTTGVYGVCDMSPEFVGKQMDVVFEDIAPDAVKIGMVSSKDIIREISSKLKKYQPRFIVEDPVMVSTSGCMLMENDAKDMLISELFAIADVITPNMNEAEVLSGISIKDKEDMVKAAEVISKTAKAAILIKGGHMTDCADDLLYVNGEIHWLRAKKVKNDNTHGTGCTLSSAIACELALGKPLLRAVTDAKKYVYDAISAGLNLGAGSGPLWHQFPI